MWLGGRGTPMPMGPLHLRTPLARRIQDVWSVTPVSRVLSFVLSVCTDYLFSLCNKFIKELKKIAFLLTILADFMHHEASQLPEWAFGKSLFVSKAVWVSTWRWENRTHSCLPEGDIQGMVLGYLWNKQRDELRHGERWDLGVKSSETCIFVVSFHSWSWDASSEMVGSLGMI